MKQLSGFLALSVNGGTRITYTYDVINDESGVITAGNQKENFYVTDPNISAAVETIREYIRSNKLSD